MDILLEWLKYLFGLMAGVIGVYREIITPPEPGKKWLWRLGWVIPAILCVVVSLNTPKGLEEAIVNWENFEKELQKIVMEGELASEKLKDLKLAVEYLADQAVDEKDSGLVCIGLRQYDRAITHLTYAANAALYGFPPDSNQLAEVYTFIGIANFLKSNYETALGSFDTAIRYKPDFVNALYNRACVLTVLDRYEEAIESFDTAIRYKPDFVNALYYRGTVVLSLDRYEEAIENFDTTIRYKPDFGDAWYYRGTAFYFLGRYEESIESFDTAIRYKPDHAIAWADRGTALFNLGQLEEAIGNFDTAINYKPDHIDAWFYRSVALFNLDRYEEALISCESALRYAPGDSLMLRLQNDIEERRK